MSRRRLASHETRNFYLFISPMLVGFLVFTAFPLVFSVILSFSEWDLVSPYKLVGLKNFTSIFTKDRYFLKSLAVTFKFAALSLPVNLVAAFLVALLMNFKVKGIGIYRTLWYSPAVTPAIAAATLWIGIFNYRYGLINRALSVLHIKGPNWLWDQSWVLPAFVIIGLWGVGGSMVIYLAALQGVPQELYDAASIDGAGALRRFLAITIPVVSPAIFFNVVMGLIGTMQYFSNAYVMTAGGPNQASLFYALYLYQNAFQWQRMGYASALAWILVLITMILTALVFRSSPLWVFYESSAEQRRKR